MTTATVHLPQALDLAAVAVGALSGAAAAAERDHADHIDVIGVAIVAIATGFGGSIARDLLLAQPPAALRSDRYLIAALAAAAVGMLCAGLVKRAAIVIAVLDAAAIGMYLSLGIAKARHVGDAPGAAVLVGIVACVGGGVVRDVLLGERVGVVRIGSLYITAALPAAVVFLVAAPVEGMGAATGGAVVTAFAVRVAALWFAWTTPPARPLGPTRRTPSADDEDGTPDRKLGPPSTYARRTRTHCEESA